MLSPPDSIRSALLSRTSSPTMLLLLHVWLLIVTVGFLPVATAVRRLPHDIQYTNNQTTWRTLKQTAVDVPIPDSPEDHRVTALPFLDQGDFQTAQYAGLLPANDKKTKYLFYWLFKYDDSNVHVDTETDIPLLIWLNGGPGCSSMDGVLRDAHHCTDSARIDPCRARSVTLTSSYFLLSQVCFSNTVLSD